MPSHTDALGSHLAGGPRPSVQLIELMGISQPTLSRAISRLGDEVVRIGAARSIQYALHDRRRGLPDIVVHRVDAEGRIHRLGVLLPVRPEGFVMRQENGVGLHHDGLPWWLFDMRPQGYLGRAYVARHAAALGLPERLADWSDTHALHALLRHGHDAAGNLLLGEAARDRFLAQSLPEPIPEAKKPHAYARLAHEAARGDLPGSSAGGEQPKFTVWAMTPTGPRHLIVKFSEAEDGPVSERWRDILLAEHWALATLREAGIAAATTRVIDHGGQRFLEVERFDRAGALGRRAQFSLTALEAEFVGAGAGNWPQITQRLAASGHIHRQAAADAALLFAFGVLIGNNDMHGGNLAFVSERGRPYALAPAYDMTPMAFAPRTSGGLPDTLPAANLDTAAGNDAWRRAATLARGFLARLQAESGFSRRFAPCLAALENHQAIACGQIERMG